MCTFRDVVETPVELLLETHQKSYGDLLRQRMINADKFYDKQLEASKLGIASREIKRPFALAVK